MAVYAVLWLFCFAGAVCYALPSDKVRTVKKGLHTPVPTRETLPYVAAELKATSYEESDEESDLLPAASRRRVQRKLVTGTEEIDGNQEYQEYQGVMGRPGVDFPILPSIPVTSFNCRKVKSSGYYADLETNCQVFHICDGGRKISFLCPNGTIFRQSHLICDWWFRVDCDRSVELYEESAEQLAADQKIYKERAQALTKAMQRGSNRSRTNNQQQFDQENSDQTSVSPNNSQNRRLNNRKHSNNRYNTLNSDNSHNSNNNNNINNNQFVSIKQEPIHNQHQTHNNKNNHFLTTYRSQQLQQRQPEISENGSQQNYKTESLEYQNFQQNIAPTYNEDFSNSNRQSNSQKTQNQKKYEPYKHENNNQQSYEQTSAKNNFQSVEQERQLPAETASFASNRNNNFGNHYIQHSYFKTSTSKAYKLPIQNELNRNILPTTSSTTETQFQDSTEQPPYNSAAINNQAPIFNSKFKPDKLLSYVELQKASSPLQGSSTLSPKPHVAFSHQITKSTTPTNLNANGSQRNVGYSQAVPTDTLLFSYPTLSSLNSHSSEDDNDTNLMQNTPIYPSFNNESSYPLVTKTHAIASSEHFATNNQPPLSTVIPEYSYTTTTESAGYYYQNNPNAPLPNSNNVQLTYPVPKVTSFSLPFPPSYVLEVSTTLLPPNYSSYTAFNNESSNGINQIIPQYNVSLAESSQHGNRVGLKVPISSGPKALHSLALYYATSESDLTTGTTSLPPTKSSKVSISEILLTSHSTSAETVTETNILPSTDDNSLSLKDISSILTKATKDSYRYLFNETSETEDNIENRNAEVKLKSLSFNDLDNNQSSVIVQQSTTKATALKINETNYFPDDQKLKESTDLRELAQVFSRALSAYLEDPESFRKVLSEVRPTEPGINTHTQTLTQESEEVLDYSDTGVSGVSPTTPTICDDGESMQVIDIDEINNLVHSVKQNLTSDNYEVPHINENKDRLQTEEFFTTGNPTSLADVNYFFSNDSNFISDINGLNVNNSYFPTAGSVHDESRPRYGGFHNNSQSEFATSYAPYGIEISENRTGKPIHETFPTEKNTEFAATTERMYINSETITESVLPVTQTSIRLESIAATLNAGDAQDVNSLVSSNNYLPKPAIGHYITSSDIFMKSTRAQPTRESSTSLPYEFNTSDDQEKVLIASSSQSLASRDNYVRFFIRKQNYGSKYQNYNTTVNNNKTAKAAENPEIKNSHIKKNSNILEPPMQFSDSGNTYSNQNFVKQSVKAKDAETVKKPEPEILNIQFKTVQHIQPLDLSSKTVHELSNIKHHNHNYHNSETVTNDPQTVISNFSTKPQHFTYQSIDLGNGVTIEHRRTIPYSRRNSWLLSEVPDNGTKVNSFSLSNLLTSLNGGHKQSEITEYSVPTNTVQPTTYHPSNLNDDFDIAESIPPRGHQLRTWQWDVQKTKPTRIPEMTGGQDHNVYYQTVVSKDAEPITTPYTESLNSATVPTIYAAHTDIETVPTAHAEQIYPEIVPTTYAELLRPEIIPTVYDELLRTKTFNKIKPVSVSNTFIRSPSDTLQESYGELLNSGSRSTLYDIINSSSTIKQDQFKSENISTTYNTKHAPPVRNSSLSAYSKRVPIHSTPALQNSSAALTEHLSSTTSREHLMLSTTDLKTIINKNDTLETEANEMFGSLNETSKNILMDMMNQAESNVTIRKLVLLLVSDQSGKENKTAEESRSQLIQALLQKPDNQKLPTQFLEESSTLVKPKNIIKSQKKEKTKNSSNTQMANYTVAPVFTSKSSEYQSTGAKTYRDTDTSTEIRTSIQLPYGTLHSSEETQNPKISTLCAQTSDFSSESDSRAVELLKSLYNLAAKWG